LAIVCTLPPLRIGWKTLRVVLVAADLALIAAGCSPLYREGSVVTFRDRSNFVRLGNGSGERRRKEDDGKSREVEVELHVEELEGCSDIYTFVEGLRFAKNGVKIGRSRVAVGMLCRQRSCYFDG
jgi:hypothetical protein